MANALANETSPYLLQHKDNPVDWRPWGPDALAAARERDVPLLLSIGYSACHWCHVMEHESFEDAGTAAYMNENFVPVKVDREERPDVDAIYMDAVQGMTGQGGWPLTAFLDPEGVPFYGGTYFPPEPRQGMPSFRMLMEAVTASWQGEREKIEAAATTIRERLGAMAQVAASEEPLSAETLRDAEATLVQIADLDWGGIGGAPKFPPASALEFLLARGERGEAVVTATLDGMARGGIHDQLGGGFARYAVDSVWLVPHFEKMLYDNALLARAYLHGWQALGHERWRAVCETTLDWALREMRGPEGGFYSALDADSEGEEGRFYVWSAAEIREVLAGAGLADTTEVEAVMTYFGASDEGNFEGEGKNILHLPGGPAAASDEPRLPDGLDTEKLERAREALLAARERRVHPGLDDKRICSWNALMIAALADAGAVLGREDYLDAAHAAAGFVWERMGGAEGVLQRTWKGESKRAPIGAFLEDHAYLVEALLVLYEATFEVRWFDAARETADRMIARFADAENGGFFTTPEAGDENEPELIVRRKDAEDHPIPSGNSAAALGLLRLAALTGEHAYEAHAEAVLRLYDRAAARHPHALGHFLQALDFHLAPSREVALVAPAGAGLGSLGELAGVYRARSRPHSVLAGGEEGAGSVTPELMRERMALEGKPAAYVCEKFACKAPVTDAAALANLLED